MDFGNLFEFAKSIWGWINAPMVGVVLGLLHSRVSKGRKQRREFEETFGVPWPRSDQERDDTADAVAQTFNMLDWEADEADSQLEHLYASTRLEDRGPTVLSYQEALEAKVAKADRAEALLTAAGYDEFLEDEDDEEAEEAA